MVTYLTLPYRKDGLSTWPLNAIQPTLIKITNTSLGLVITVACWVRRSFPRSGFSLHPLIYMPLYLSYHNTSRVDLFNLFSVSTRLCELCAGQVANKVTLWYPLGCSMHMHRLQNALHLPNYDGFTELPRIAMHAHNQKGLNTKLTKLACNFHLKLLQQIWEDCPIPQPPPLPQLYIRMPLHENHHTQ